MLIRIKKPYFVLELLILFLGLAIFSFAWFYYLFWHLELHFHSFVVNNFVVGLTALVATALLLYSLGMRNRTLSALIQERESQSLIDINRDFEQSIDAIPDLISIHDIDFRIVKINKALAEYLGETPDKICGKYCYELFHDSSKPHKDCPHKKVLSHKEAVTEEIIDPESGKALKITCTPLHGRDGKLKGSIHHVVLLSDNENEDRVVKEGISRFNELILDLRSNDFIMTMCSGCNSYRDENNEWQKVASFFMEKTSIKLSHGICPDCIKNLYPDYFKRFRS